MDIKDTRARMNFYLDQLFHVTYFPRNGGYLGKESTLAPF